MNKPLTLNVLLSHRRALLLAETAAWLHMLGKLHEDFLAGKHTLDISIPVDVPDELKTLLEGKWAGKIWQSLDECVPELESAEVTISDFIQTHRNRGKQKPSSGLLRLMVDAHGRGSGVEKGAMVKYPAQTKQDKIFISSALGKETESIDPLKIEKKRQELYQKLIQILTNIKKNQSQPTNIKKNQSQLTKKDIEYLRSAFSISVADTRRPVNDVTLYDQTVASVAFFKSALAQVLLTGWKDPLEDQSSDKYQWRILRIGLNGPAFWGHADRISDLLARKGLIKTLLDQINELLERNYPVGSEIYRDENGSLYLMPDIPDLLEYEIKGKPLEDVLQQMAVSTFQGETQLEIHLSTTSSRNMRIFGKLVIKELPSPAPTLTWAQSAWSKTKTGKNYEVCTVCGLRPQGPSQKARERKVCDVCEHRRQERSKEWVQNPEKFGASIWMSEIADINGRLALLIGQFDLARWLDGDAFNSIVRLDPNGSADWVGYRELADDCTKALSNIKQTLGKNTPALASVLPSTKVLGIAQYGDIYDRYVQDTGLEGEKRDGWRLALALMRQQPSFARIRRVWETTQEFWNATGNKLSTSVGTSGPRLEIRGNINFSPNRENDSNLGPYHAYELLIPDGVRLNVVWDQQNERFITADNLSRIANQLGWQRTFSATSFLLKKIWGQTLVIQEPGGYGSQVVPIGALHDARANIIPNSEYVPTITLLTEPLTFIALAPADSALQIISDIRHRYEIEMGKVRNRLPLRLGVIYAPQHTPVRILLDAGRRMLQGNLLPFKDWEVTEISGDQCQVNIMLQFENRQVHWQVPVVMGNGCTLDAWYPYAYLPEGDIENRARAVKSINPWSDFNESPQGLVHVNNLRQGDRIYFTPSTLDFIWLGTASQRFEIAYTTDGKRYRLNRRPYLLDELDYLDEIWETLKNHLSTNQIYMLRDVVEDRRERWSLSPEDLQPQGSFWQFCHDALANADWQNITWDNKSLSRWTDYAVKGWLADAVELHLHILKERT